MRKATRAQGGALAGPDQGGWGESVTREGWQADGSSAEARKHCMAERWQEEQNQWSLSRFDSELVWAAHSGKD